MKSNSEVATAFANGVACRNNHLSTDGEWLTSYYTRVALRDTKHRIIWITSTKYSVTTSRHLSEIPCRGGMVQMLTHSLSSPVEGAVAHIRDEAAKTLARQVFVCNLPDQLKAAAFYQRELDQLGQITHQTFAPIVPPMAMLQRCAKHGVPVDLRLWALAHGKAE